MKKLIVSLLLLATVTAKAQLVTNNVKVVLTTAEDAVLRTAWKLDSNARTNGLPPYVTTDVNGVVTPAPVAALTYSAWQDLKGGGAFKQLSETLAAQNEAVFLEKYRQLTDVERARVIRIVNGLQN